MKESSRDFDTGDSQMTAATCFDQRTIILDWSGRKLVRLCKWRLAAQAQHAANVADILESVKVHVASRKSATLDLQMGETMTRHGVFVLTTEAKVVRCVQEQSFTMGDHEARNSDQTENRESEIPTSWMKLVLDKHSAGVGWRADHDKPETMVLPTSCGPTQPRTMPYKNDKKLLDWCSDRRHSEWRCLGLQATWRLKSLCSRASAICSEQVRCTSLSVLVPDASVTHVTCEGLISAKPFVSLKRSPCVVPHCFSSESDEKQNGSPTDGTRGRTTRTFFQQSKTRGAPTN